jgi:excinuclease UvrABC nuclease subunit
MLDGSVRRVIYVGQAEKLGYRLSNWFRDGSRDARAMQQWKIKPEYVAVVPVQEAHEAASLESYLISRLATTSNIRGRPKEFETMFRSSEEGERHFWRDGVLHTLNSGPRE